MSPDLVSPLAEFSGMPHDQLRNGGSVWAAWTLDLPVLIPAAFAAFVYARGLRRWTDRRRPHYWWQTACYYVGLATLVIALVSPIDALGAQHFFMHMIQHELEILVAIPLILLGAPTTPVLRGLPKQIRLGVVAELAGKRFMRALWRALSHPMTGLISLNVLLFAWHLAPGWYDAALNSQTMHYVQHLSLATASWLFWWNVIDPAPLHAPLGYLVRIVYVLAAGTAQSILAALLAFSDRPLYETYINARRVFDIEPLADQELGGLIMWVPGQLIHLLVIGILFAVWAVKSERAQKKRETEASLA